MNDELTRNKKIMKFLVYFVAILVFVIIPNFVIIEKYVTDEKTFTFLIIYNIVILIVGISLIGYIECKTGYFMCPNCGENFVPTYKDYLLGIHTIMKRRLKCPKCGKTHFCIKTLEKKELKK